MMMKRWGKVIVYGILAIIFLVILKNALFQSFLTAGLSKAAHVPVKAGKVNVSFLSSCIDIDNLKIYNPKGFPEKVLAVAPKIYIDFEPAELLKGRARFKEVRLNLSELTVIRRKDGSLNVDALKPDSTERKESKEVSQTVKKPSLYIDKLRLTIGRVTYKDYSVGPEPMIQSYQVGIEDREYTGIDNPGSLISLIMFESLAKTALAGLADLDLHAFKEGGMEALAKSLGIVGNSKEAVQSAAKKLLNLF